MYMKSLRWALVVTAVLLAVSMVTIMALASRAGTGCKSRPEGQMWSQKHRLFLSSVDQDWEGSRAFCTAHRAMLPLLNHTQDFLRRYRVTRSSWVGARRGPKGWHWIDGLPLESQLLPQDSEDHPDLSCGSLEEGELVALNCSSLRPWVCIREAE